MESLNNKTADELDALANGIIGAIFFQRELFGKDIFSRSILGGKNRVKLNSALFEVWVSQAYVLSEQEKKRLIYQREALISDYRLLLNNPDFTRAVATSTSGKAAVKLRFEGIINIINKFKNDNKDIS